MKINLVVFGCDNSGKTTLCNNLAEYLKDEGIKSYVTHSIGPGNITKHVMFMSNVLTDKSGNLLEVQILDRFPIIEEFVCGNVLRNYDTFKDLPDGVAKFMGAISLFIYCNPPYEKVANWGDREQMEGVKENAKNMYDLYKMVPEHFNITSRTVKYDYVKDDYRHLAKNVLDYVWFLYRNKLEHYEEV